MQGLRLRRYFLRPTHLLLYPWASLQPQKMMKKSKGMEKKKKKKQKSETVTEMKPILQKKTTGKTWLHLERAINAPWILLL